MAPSIMRLLVVLALISVACALPRRQNRIVGGTPVPIEKYPFMASMQITWREGIFAHVCGGSLITRTTVLSASHCFISVPAVVQWRARLGSRIASAGGAHHTVSRFIFHPDYIHVLLKNDIAMVRLAAPATLSDKIQVARIAGPNYPLPDHMRLYVAGWGYTHWNATDISDDLLHTDVRVINHHICTERYDELRAEQGINFQTRVTADMLCTGHLDVGGQDACSGDSGGPVVHGGDIVVGITSWGWECAHPRYPGVNVRVPSYTQWIVDNALA